MTVQELIDHLMAVEDKTKRVDVEGCDCINAASGFDPTWHTHAVLIEADT